MYLSRRFPASPWAMQELQSLYGVGNASRGLNFLCQLISSQLHTRPLGFLTKMDSLKKTHCGRMAQSNTRRRLRVLRRPTLRSCPCEELHAQQKLQSSNLQAYAFILPSFGLDFWTFMERRMFGVMEVIIQDLDRWQSLTRNPARIRIHSPGGSLLFRSDGVIVPRGFVVKRLFIAHGSRIFGRSGYASVTGHNLPDDHFTDSEIKIFQKIQTSPGPFGAEGEWPWQRSADLWCTRRFAVFFLCRVSLFVPLGTIGSTQAETPLVIPIRGQLDKINRLMRADIYIGRLEAEEPREEPLLQRVQSLAVRPRCGDPQVHGKLAVPIKRSGTTSGRCRD